MSEQEQAQTRQDIQARIIAKAWKNEAYKQELLTNPKAVIEREFGVEFPADVKVQVVEENPTSLHFVLPMSPVAIAQEFSEEQLEAIAGGASATAVSAAAKQLTKWVANNQGKLFGTPAGALSVSASYYGVTKK